mmetsp:Transcript_25865/g.65199  ORF Transcript_25865/g.65199 Transcript_25865/m.65199 type:complete len:298 (-) Transcript_25865:911-1804(-)|eukprot:CAMPEP_0178985940 /NCGR_PEP_ID=MMETSP0795-20121207/2428_1 /TAXON_ID=88552 /ORGANISM="Amoebophrya sp., Strain Ameob2" /LENGTH=297 /DNA_ID=CAMNT_0020676947 /DNA_START=243 /DNA_END=1136 /DNA_ORIENTATION=+
MNPTSAEPNTIGLAAGPDDERGVPVALSAPPQLELNGSSPTPTRLLSGATEADLALVKDRLRAAGYGQEKILAVWGVSDATKALVAEGVFGKFSAVCPLHFLGPLAVPCVALTLPCVLYPMWQSQRILVAQSVADSTLYVLSEHAFFRVHRDWAPRSGYIESCATSSGGNEAKDLATGVQPLNRITGVALDSGLTGTEAREYRGSPVRGAAQTGVRLKVPASSELNKLSSGISLDLKKWKLEGDPPVTVVRLGYENSYLVACEDETDAAKIINDAWEHAKRVDGVPPEIMQQQMAPP